MRKLLLACLLLACVKLNAQEQINTSPIYFQNGDISIGTPNIRTPLYLFSNRPDCGLRIEAAGKSTGIYLHIAGGDYGFFSLGGGTVLRGNGQISSIVGKLSIGKGNPRHMLDVNGTSIFNGTIYQEGGNGTGLRIDHSSGNSFGVGNWGDRMEWYHVANGKQDWALLTLKCNEAGDAKFRINGYADPNGANLQVDGDASVGGMLKA